LGHYASTTVCTSHSLSLLFLQLPRPPGSTLFPYTTLFRSDPLEDAVGHLFVQVDHVALALPTGLLHRQAHERGVLRSDADQADRSEEHTSELQSRENLVCRLLLEKKKRKQLHGLMIFTYTH